MKTGTTERLEKTIRDESRYRTGADFQQLNDFYQRMKAAGIATQKQYELPLPDTVGRRYASDTSNDNQCD